MPRMPREPAGTGQEMTRLRGCGALNGDAATNPCTR